jgi:hypothetical protein
VKDVAVHYRGGWDPVHPGTATVSYTVSNTGNVPLQAHRTLHAEGLLGVFGKTSAQPDVPLLLPGNSVHLTGVLTGVWPGVSLHASVRLAPFTAVVALGSPVPQAAASADASAVPWTWFLAFLLVLAATVLWTLRSRRRHRASTAPEETAPALSHAG